MHPIATACLMASVLASVLAGCVSKKEIREARGSVYDAEFPVVYSGVLAAVRGQYPNLDDDPATGKIRTAWHQVQMENPSDDPQSPTDPAGLTGASGPNGVGGTQTRAVRRTFIRFDVTVLGGRPWRVRIVGHASEWNPGDAVPVELRGGDEPQWLAGRTDALEVAIFRKLKSYARAAPRSAAPVAEAETSIDLATLGPIPAPAAQAVAKVRQAVTARDLGALRAVTAADVTWSFGAEPGIDGAFALWQADPEVLDQLGTAIDAGCRPDGATRVACPPAAIEQDGYVGWRAVFEPRGASWAMTAFVQGD